MANFDVIVKLVDQTKSSVTSIETGLKSIEDKANKASTAASKLGTALTALATGALTSQLVNVAQAFGDMETRIRATAGSGANTQAVMDQLLTSANKLGISLHDATAAFSILRANGIDASYNSLETFQKLALASGRSLEDIADAIGNAYQGSFGKLSKATEDMIQVDERFGQYQIKVKGQILDTVGSTAQAVDVIKRYISTNKDFSDAFVANSNGITAALNRLQNTITGDKSFGELNNSIANVINKFTDLIAGSGEVGKSIKYLTTFINFIGDNFKALATIVGAAGTAWLTYTKILPLVSTGVNAVGNAIRGTGAIIGFLLQPITIISDAFTYFTRNILRFAGVLPTAFGGVSSLLFAVAALVKGGLRLFGWIAIIDAIIEGVNLLVKAFTGFDILDWVADKYDKMIDKAKEWLGIAKQGVDYSKAPNESSAETKRLAAANSMAAAATPTTGTTNPGISPLQQYINGIGMGLAQARNEAKALEPVLKKALAAGDLNLASAYAAEYASRMERLGVVVEKDAALVNREFAMAVEKTRIELEQQNIQLLNTETLTKKWANETRAAMLPLEEMSMKLADANQRTAMFNLELATTNVELDKQRKRLDEPGYALAKYNQELTQSGLALKEQAIRLADAASQQRLFDQTLTGVRQGTQQQQITLNLLNQAYAAGTITLREYTDALGQIDERLQGVNEITAKAVASGREEARMVDIKLQSYQDLIKQFKDGKLSANEFRKAAGSLGENTDEIDRIANSYGTVGDRIKDTNKIIKDSVRDAATTFSDEFSRAFVKGQGMLDSFKNFFSNIMNDIATKIIKQQLADPLANAIGGAINGMIGGMNANAAGGSLFSGVGDWLAGLFKASGGPVEGGSAYVVGEKGPELFIPNGNGNIVPNNQLGSANAVGGGALNVNFTINAIDTQTGVQFLLQNKPAIIGMVGQAYNQRGRRGPLD